ncbi:hypothetical protein CHS0354_029684 [Potamilus streckersoni]|uniref:Laccase n=1 Tax=Potamilus streckersoni TaxID=2493646 RepID=A0AAE0RTI9_9BIVA|nr:hypothetical protein CHS0354_029684 [Potamilus streckersoni]
MSDSECEFHLEIDHRLTMMKDDELVYAKDGRLYKYGMSNSTLVESVPVDDVISGDGWRKPCLIGAVNGKMPGPNIIVYEGQTVVVHVKNSLINEILTMHWHGLSMRGTPWMDGAPFITQCPILPGQTFIYSFHAYPKGTFWYHSHIGTQQSMGIYGAFIIRERDDNIKEEHIISIMEYNHEWDTEMSYLKDIYGLYQRGYRVPNSKSLDDAEFDAFQFDSGLINGRGRFHDSGTKKHNDAPLEVFEVSFGKPYKFRVIGAGRLYPFRVSIDNHILEIIASDGYNLEPIEVESFVINPGERFDFILIANQSVSNYWIRAETLEVNKGHRTEAILRYRGAPDKEPVTSRKQCLSTDRCIVLNCPFLYFPDSEATQCLTFNDVKAVTGCQPVPKYHADKFEEYFLNFGVPGENPAFVNGRVFQTPTHCEMSQPLNVLSSCDKSECGKNKVCRCPHSIRIRHGTVVQLVLLNMGIGKGQSHPIHLHGYSFYVLKMGYGNYNKTTGKIISDNFEIDCRDTLDRDKSLCNQATWSNSSWINGNVPHLELKRAPRKDTIIVPTGGYVIIRFQADNPGVWYLHCHLENHNMEGMRMLIIESPEKIPPPPSAFSGYYGFTYMGILASENKFHETDSGK